MTGHRDWIPQLLAVVLIGAAAWGISHRHLPWKFLSGDEPEYAEVARRLADGRGFTTGIMSINWSESERMTWRYGLFRPLNDPFGVAVGNWQVAGRIPASNMYESLLVLAWGVGLFAVIGVLCASTGVWGFLLLPVFRATPEAAAH